MLEMDRDPLCLNTVIGIHEELLMFRSVMAMHVGIIWSPRYVVCEIPLLERALSH